MSRDAILRAIRRHLPESSPLPDLDGPWTVYPDPVAQFTAVLEQIGGKAIRIADRASLVAELNRLPQFVDSRTRLSRLADCVPSDIDLATVDDPHLLEKIDFAILPGEFGVAENGAVWVTDRGLRHRVVYFLCQHLALVVPADQIVHNMHEAYRRIHVDQAGFGTFLSGPSKTADIEQSLVIGAHGPKSLTVFLVDSV